MSVSEYLVAYGQSGEFGRFRSAVPLTCQRGDRVVVRTHRGVEAGQILRAAEAGHARFLPNTTLGQLLRPLGAEDVRTEAQLRDRRSEVWGRASQLAEDLGLPLQVLDAEILLDGEHVVLHHLRGADCDVRPFVSTLAREFDLHVLLVDLTRSGESAPHADEEEHAEHGCGSCGSGGGCGSCGSGGGCGSCSTNAATVVPAPPDAAYFAGLREQMERQRTPLL